MAMPPKGRADHLVLGDWNALCSMCGMKRKASTLVKNWQGMYRCPEHDEPRHPQDFVRGVTDTMGVPWSQPVPTDTFDFTQPLITEDSVYELNYLVTENLQLIITES